MFFSELYDMPPEPVLFLQKEGPFRNNVSKHRPGTGQFHLLEDQ